MERREFIKICAAGAAMAAGNTFALTNTEPRFYSRTRLVDYDGRPFKTSRLQIKQNYIFHYPFLGTPCFLLNLGKPTLNDAMLLTADGKSYRGGRQNKFNILRHAGQESKIPAKSPIGVIKCTSCFWDGSSQFRVTECKAGIENDDKKSGDGEASGSSLFQSQVPTEIHA